MSIHRNRRAVSLNAAQQIAMVANMMALELDPANPHHAALLESLERALFRLRNEKGDANGTGINMAVPSGDLCNRPVLRSTDMGMDISLPDRLCRIADLTCEIDVLKNGLSAYSNKAIASAVDKLHDVVESECMSAEITSIYGSDIDEHQTVFKA